MVLAVLEGPWRDWDVSAIVASREDRPDHLPVPANERHEFLKEPLPESHPIVRAWIAWFKRRHVRYLVKQVGTRKVGKGQMMPLIQLYTHRFMYQSTGGNQDYPRWCCR